MSEHKALSKIKANNEYGQIKEMFFGRVDDLRVPEWDPIAFRWVDKKMADVFKRTWW